MLLSVTLWKSAWDAEVTASRSWTLETLHRALTMQRPKPADKRQCPAWSPVKLKPGATKRGLDSVAEVSCLVLDYDGTADVSSALDVWRGNCLLWHTSWSHTPEIPRFRVVLPLASPIPAGTWRHCYAWAGERDPRIDRQCSDASRLWFLPVVGPGFGAGFLPGPLLDLSAIKPPPPPAPRRTAPLPPGAPSLRYAEPAAREALAARLGRCSGRYARSVPCPSCGKDSVSFTLAPNPGEYAGYWCNHRNSCGHRGWLDTLPGA